MRTTAELVAYLRHGTPNRGDSDAAAGRLEYLDALVDSLHDKIRELEQQAAS